MVASWISTFLQDALHYLCFKTTQKVHSTLWFWMEPLANSIQHCTRVRTSRVNSCGFLQPRHKRKKSSFRYTRAYNWQESKTERGEKLKTRGRNAELGRDRVGRANYFSLFSIIIFCFNESNQRRCRRSQRWKKWSAEQSDDSTISEKSSQTPFLKKMQIQSGEDIILDISSHTAVQRKVCVMWLWWLEDTAANMNRKATSWVWGLGHTCAWVGLLRECHAKKKKKTHRLMSNPRFITC